MSIVGAFMVPHPPLIIETVGRGKEQTIFQTIAAYRTVASRIAALRPETIVVTSPHTAAYMDYFHISPGAQAHGDFGEYGARQTVVDAQYDEAFRNMLCALAKQNNLPAGTRGERDRRLDHATMIPLYFINPVWSHYKLVRVGLSGRPLTEHYALGECIKHTAEQLKRRTVFIASGDLSHVLQKDGPYGYKPEGPQFDERIMDVMGRGAFLELFDFERSFCERAAECGHRSFVIMAGALDSTAVKAETLSYEGPFGVGYGICAFTPEGDDPTRDFRLQYRKRCLEQSAAKRKAADVYVRLARESLETYVKNREVISIPEGLPKELTQTRAGAFVSLKKNGQLRGCIGTIAATQPTLAQEIINNAISAATRDPRFPPVTKNELSLLDCSVDILSQAEPVWSERELDPKRYGVIVSMQDGRRGLLLPNLDGVDTVQEQLAIARQKAGIQPEEQAEIERFEVVRHL